MALSTPQANNALVKFRREVTMDFYRKSRFDPWIGADTTSVIARIADLADDGKEIRVPLVAQLSGEGVGSGVQDGNEEKLDDYGFAMWADYARNAVATKEIDVNDASFDIPSTARSALRTWAKSRKKNDMVDMLLSIPTESIQSGRGGNPGNRVNGIRWSAATAGNRNSWLTANSDRVLFGNAIANQVAGNFTSSAANVDSTNDLANATTLNLLKELASASTDNKIAPYQTPETDEEWYVLFCGRRAMNQFRADADIKAFNKDARPRESQGATKSGGNPYFTGSSLVYNGVYITEIPEITDRLLLTGIGASSINVEPMFLCGQGAYAEVTGRMPTPTTKSNDDYQFVRGFGIKASYGVGKIAKKSAISGLLKDWGVVTGFVAGV